tara:strand:- start:254 stop:670 length:417 start_codon:yes stop_codon:yes gene_type:complete
MNVRKIDINDYSIVNLLEQFKGDPLKISKDQFEDFISKLHDNHLIMVIENNQEIICCGTIIIETKLMHNMGKVGHIEDIITHSSYRGQGLGKKIINSLVSYAKKCGCYKVILDCSIINIPFYQKCGFEQRENQMALYF